MKNIQKLGLIVERVSDILPDMSQSNRKRRKSGRNNLKKNKNHKRIQRKAIYNSMFYGYY